MNQRKAKVLRSMALSRTPGMPMAKYQRGRNGNIELVPQCTRRLYKAFKRAVNQGVMA